MVPMLAGAVAVIYSAFSIPWLSQPAADTGVQPLSTQPLFTLPLFTLPLLTTTMSARLSYRKANFADI